MLVKKNHPLLLHRLESVFAAAILYEAEFDCATHTHVGHGRRETRTLQCTYDLPRRRNGAFRRFTGFAGVRQAFRLERTVVPTKSGRHSREVAYGITRLPRLLAGAERLNALVRGHWTIENRVHWVRDVTMGEDASQVRVGNVPQVMAALRNTALAVLRREGYTNIAAARRYLAANPKQALRMIGCQITE
jgi:predicted transposase YbfD/YdcC